MENESMLYEHGKGNSRRFALLLLETLEGVFPKWTTSSEVIIKWGYQEGTLETLRKNNLIEMTNIEITGLPKEEGKKFIEAYKITADGINFLNSLKQKKMNERLLRLTWAIVFLTVVLAIEPISKIIRFLFAQF